MEMSRLERAILLATEAHAGQIDEDDQPHVVHSLEVMFAVKRELDAFPQFLPEGYTVEDMMTTGVLHDVLEDTATTFDEIRRLFGDKIADTVNSVSRVVYDECVKCGKCKSDHSSDTHFFDPKKEPYRDLIYRAAKSPASKILKIADLGVNRKRTHTIPESKVKWRNKLEYKYDISLRVLLAELPTSWEEASWEWHATNAEIATFDETGGMKAKGKYFIADPNGKKIEISEEEFYEKYKLAKREHA